MFVWHDQKCADFFFFQPNFEKLEKIVEEAKKHQLEAKLKARIGLNSLDGTPNSVSVTSKYTSYLPHSDDWSNCSSASAAAGHILLACMPTVTALSVPENHENQ